MNPSDLRVGQGFDVHRFTDDPDRPSCSAGCRFDGERGLEGHSDADVIAHACSDALLGAAGLGDIGMHFPDTDPTLVRSRLARLLLRSVMRTSPRRVRWAVANVDCAVVCERPKIAPRRDEMQRTLSRHRRRAGHDQGKSGRTARVRSGVPRGSCVSPPHSSFARATRTERS